MGGLRRVQMGGLGVAMVCRNGWMGGWIFFTNHDSIYGWVVYGWVGCLWVGWVFMGGFLSSSLCISYEAKSLQMKKGSSSENSPRIYFSFRKFTL